MNKNCQICNKDFIAYGERKNTALFCSMKCYGLSKIGNCIPWNKGKKMSKEYCKNISLSLLGKTEKNSRNWKGSKASYGAVHKWFSKKYGNPHYCEFCRNTKLRHRQYHWANRSGKYLRDLSDWLRLCVRCHSKYDKSGRMELYLLK